MSIELKIKKKLGAFTLDVAFQTENDVLALLGSSGCGKSMTLRCIAGIEKPDEGYIIVNGITYFDSKKRINLSPQKRRVGLLFQNYALFPNMTVEQNILTGLRREKDSAVKKEKLAAAIKNFHLEGLEKHLPHQLSGGQQQRTALARILVSEPEILMLDEPFSALDSYLRWQMEQELKQRLADYTKTTLFVSHDRDEVYRVADRIAVYGNGNIEVLDEKTKVFADPITWQAAKLTGCKNLSMIRDLGDGTCLAENWGLRFRLPEDAKEKGCDCIGIRAHYLKLAEQPSENEQDHTFEYELLDNIPDSFERVLLIRKKGAEAKEPIQWMISKDMVYEHPLTGYVQIPDEAIMWLRSR